MIDVGAKKLYDYATMRTKDTDTATRQQGETDQQQNTIEFEPHS